LNGKIGISSEPAIALAKSGDGRVGRKRGRKGNETRREKDSLRVELVLPSGMRRKVEQTEDGLPVRSEARREEPDCQLELREEEEKEDETRRGEKSTNFNFAPPSLAAFSVQTLITSS